LEGHSEKASHWLAFVFRNAGTLVEVKDKTLVALGRNLHRIRVASGTTQEKLAERAELSRRYIQELEAGEKGPTIPTLARLRVALRTTWEDIFRDC